MLKVLIVIALVSALVLVLVSYVEKHRARKPGNMSGLTI